MGAWLEENEFSKFGVHSAPSTVTPLNKIQYKYSYSVKFSEVFLENIIKQTSS